MRITVVGLGYVGLVTAACVAEWGNHVVGIDASKDRLTSLLAGRLPIVEPGLTALVSSNREAGRLEIRGPADLERSARDADVVMVAVGTHDGNGGWQTDTISQTLDQLVPFLGSTTALVIRSTLPPDYVAQLGAYVETRFGRASAVPVLLNPEFTREGSAVLDFMQPDRVVLGIVRDETNAGRQALTELYAPTDAPIVVLPAVDASVGKLAANLFLATKISFANELAGFCDGYGASIDNVVTSMSYDTRIGGAFLRPGVGFGGSCLPHQVSMALLTAQELEIHAPLLAAVKQINELQPNRVLTKLADLLPSLEGARIALLGLTFKPDTDDCRESPALKVARKLQTAGADIIAYDPMPSAAALAQANYPDIKLARTVVEALTGADAAILATDWEAFRHVDYAAAGRRMHNAIMIDGRNTLDRQSLTDAGWVYHAFGRGTSYPDGWMKPTMLASAQPTADTMELSIKVAAG